jgi:hypothetical protein
MQVPNRIRKKPSNFPHVLLNVAGKENSWPGSQP